MSYLQNVHNMRIQHMLRLSFCSAVICLSSASAQEMDIKGLIKVRSGATMILETATAQTLTVILTDSTEVGQIQGLLKARNKKMSMAALIPGLAVEIKAVADSGHQLIAESVKFKGDDLKRALAIQAGLRDTRDKAHENAADIRRAQEDLEKQRVALQAQSDALWHQQEKLAAAEQKISQNKAAIEAAIARFGQLDDYYILDEVTVYFGNGKVSLDPMYKPMLLQLMEKARSIQGYMIETTGFASSSGSEALNQRLSEERAASVVNFLTQQGHLSMTNLLAPAAMGESAQIADDKSAESEEKNRRVVVRVLQNKAMAGLTAGAH